MVADAPYHQRRLGDEVGPPGAFGGLRGGDRVLQARGELAGPVLRRSQLGEQHRTIGVVHPGGLGGGQRGGQVAGGVLEGQPFRRRRRGGPGPLGGLAQGRLVRSRPQQVLGDLTAPFGSLPGERGQGRGGAAVQPDALVFAEAGVDAVADQGVARLASRPGGWPAR